MDTLRSEFVAWQNQNIDPFALTTETTNLTDPASSSPSGANIPNNSNVTGDAKSGSEGLVASEQSPQVEVQAERERERKNTVNNVSLPPPGLEGERDLRDRSHPVKLENNGPNNSNNNNPHQNHNNDKKRRNRYRNRNHNKNNNNNNGGNGNNNNNIRANKAVYQAIHRDQ